MSEKLVGLARQRDALVAILCCETGEGSRLRCALVEKRIDEIKEAVSPCLPSVREAWRSLECARLDDPRAIASALHVLLETVPGGVGARGVLPVPGPALTGPRRTAAHPRGFRGRRRALPALVDLRPLLAETGTGHTLRQTLQQRGAEAFPLLAAAGYERDRLQALMGARDPYVAYHHGSRDGTLAILPVRFRTTILSLLRSRSWSEVLEAVSLFRALDFERDDALLASISYLLSVASGHGVAWWGLIATQPAERRAQLLDILFETRAYEVEPNGLRSALDALGALDGWKLGDRLRHLLACVRGGVPTSHVFEGFRLADDFDPEHHFVHRCAREVVSPRPTAVVALEARLRVVLSHVAEGLADWSWSAVDLWERCSEEPALARWVTSRSLLEWSPKTTLRALGLVLDWNEGVPTEKRARLLTDLLRRVPPESHAAALDVFAELLDRRLDDDERRVRLPLALAVMARLDGGSKSETTWAATMAADLAAAARLRDSSRLVGAPEASFRRLLHSLRADNRARLLHEGLEAMAGRIGSLAIEAFGACPEALFHTARLLGGVAGPRRFALLRRFRAHPLAQRRFARKSVEEMCRILRRHAASGLPNPIPRKLRAHLDGEAELKPTALERHRQALMRGLPQLRLALLRRMVLDDLGRGLPSIDTGDANELHALQMLGWIRRNRRLLRRVLRIPPGLRRSFLLGHPANQVWLRKHPRVDAGLWVRGLERVVDVEEGPIRLAIEQDPTEALRLGTEVGSCLSIGGHCGFSSVAVMADVNKRVVFARSAHGNFVARQIVAIAEDDRIVFFPVYPLSASEAVKAGFFEYDLALARALGLEPYRSKVTEDYSIALVLAQDFYDDGLWDRFLIRDEATVPSSTDPG